MRKRCLPLVRNISKRKRDVDRNQNDQVIQIDHGTN